MNGIIRPAIVQDAEGIGRVSVIAWRETYAGIMPDDYLAALSIEQRANVFRDRIVNLPDRQRIFVALDHAEHVVGFGVSGPAREIELGTDGEVFAINIVDAAKRQGLGVRLMAAMADALLSHSLSQVGLWVIDRNEPARRFYETLGGRAAAKKDQLFGSKSIVELGYVWSSLAALQRAAQELMERRG